MSLAGLTALVTGATSGIGRAIALRLAAEGAAVAVAGRRQTAGEAVVEELWMAGTKAAFVELDVTDPASIAAGFAKATAKLGPITLLVNNAGVARAAPIAKTDQALWNGILATDLTGPFLCIQAALPGMLEAGFGRIVNVASTAGQTGYAYCAAYCAAKHGVIGLTRALARELAAKPVTVNAVCPGYTDTPMVEDTIANIVAKTGRTREQALAELVIHNPQGRLITPEEVAEVVAFLCRPAAASITGQSLGVAGGEVM